MLYLPKWCKELSEEGGKKEERRGVQGKGEGQQLILNSLFPWKQKHLSGFRNFSCRLTGLAICDLAEHSHGINIKSLLKWRNFKWLKLICAFTHFKWIQSLFSNLLILDVNLISLPFWIWFLNQDSCRKQGLYLQCILILHILICTIPSYVLVAPRPWKRRPSCLF